MHCQLWRFWSQVTLNAYWRCYQQQQQQQQVDLAVPAKPANRQHLLDQLQQLQAEALGCLNPRGWRVLRV
jgi:hypothetical protein